MNISIIGAAGEVGRSLATHLLRGGLITASDRLQLIAHGPEGTERKLLAERVDLLDAFEETAPRIDLAGTPDDVAGDIVVMAAGATVSETMRTRRERTRFRSHPGGATWRWRIGRCSKPSALRLPATGRAGKWW